MDAVTRTLIASAAVTLLALLALAVATRPPPAVPTVPIPDMASVPPAAGFDDPALSGMCNEMTAELAEGEPGAATRAEAIANLVDRGEFPYGLTVDGHRILFQGEPVGSLSTEEAAAGGYVVVAYEWCHP